MKKEIIYTEDYSLIVSDERIKDVRPYKGKYHLEQGHMIYQFPTYLTDLNECKLIIAHRPLKDARILEGVPLLPEFSQQDGVEKEAKEYADNSSTCAYVDGINVGKYQGFLEGYKKSKERFKYTEEDLREAFTAGLMNRYSRVGEAVAETEFIQSLQQPKRPESILLETIGDSTMINKCKNFDIETGCIALRCTCENVSKPKTTTNLQGQIELVGSYIY